MRITVIGTGYLGAVHAAGMAELGHEVLGVDTDREKIDALTAAHAPFFEPGLPELLRKGVQSGRLRFTTSMDEAAAFGEVHFVCVGTPQQPDSDAADLTYVDAVIDALAARVSSDCLIVGKSTVPVGTAQRLAERLRAGSRPGVHCAIAWNPEFLREGFAVQDTLFPDRLVFGVDDPTAEGILRRVYAPILATATPCIVTDLATAELVKVAANSFLATKISFINAMAEVCEVTGADVVTLADAIGHDARIGRRFLNSGIGFGGGCLGKDIRAFRARGLELGLGSSLDFLRNVDDINVRRRQRVLDLAAELLDGDVAGKWIGLLGAAFKPNSDDVRDSPALHVANALHELGALVRVHDPEAIENGRLMYPKLDFVDDIEKVFENAELVIHLTEWSEYGNADAVALQSLAARPTLIDARNTLDIDAWHSAGWSVHPLGRSSRTVDPVQARVSVNEQGVTERKAS